MLARTHVVASSVGKINTRLTIRCAGRQRVCVRLFDDSSASATRGGIEPSRLERALRPHAAFGRQAASTGTATRGGQRLAARAIALAALSVDVTPSPLVAWTRASSSRKSLARQLRHCFASQKRIAPIFPQPLPISQLVRH